MDKYNQDVCNYKFKVLSVEKVIDGDTIDVIIDLGFDILTRQRVRLLGIDTPESRTSDKVEKIYGNLAKKELSNSKTARQVSGKNFLATPYLTV